MPPPPSELEAQRRTDDRIAEQTTNNKQSPRVAILLGAIVAA